MSRLDATRRLEPRETGIEVFELTGGFRIGDVIWYGSLGPNVQFRIVSLAINLETGEEECQAEIVRSPYRREDGYNHYMGAVVPLGPPSMYRLVERDILALDWMREDSWNLGERLSRSRVRS